MLRQSFSSPPVSPPAVALLTALGYLQDLRAGDAVTDMTALAAIAGIAPDELVPLIDRGEADGHLAVDADGAVRLTLRGWRWYETRDSR